MGKEKIYKSSEGREIKWFHQIKLSEGETTPGLDVSEWRWKMLKGFVPNLTGKTVLDIGAWDGFFSFKAEELGASRVVACDHYMWDGGGWGNKDGFNYAKEALSSSVEEWQIPFKDIKASDTEQFDIIFFFGVLYHLQSFLPLLVELAKICKEHLIIETLIENDLPKGKPLFRFYPFNGRLGDETIWFVPNQAAMVEMIRYLPVTLKKQGKYGYKFVNAVKGIFQTIK